MVLSFEEADLLRKPRNFAPCKNFLLYGTSSDLRLVPVPVPVACNVFLMTGVQCVHSYYLQLAVQHQFHATFFFPSGSCIKCHCKPHIGMLTFS